MGSAYRIHDKEKFSESMLRDINLCRRSLGMSEIMQRGKKCLKCGGDFLSPDVRKYFYCKECRPKQWED